MIPANLLASPKLEKLARRFAEDGSRRGVTALKSYEVIWDEFVLDSLVGLHALPAEGEVLDIGTGGGIPGLVLAIARPDLEFTLTDSALKKTEWVREVALELELKNVDVATARLEIIGQDESFREQFDAVTAKALAPLNVLCELAVPLLKVGGRLLAYKGPALTDEIRDAHHSLTELQSKVHRCSGYTVGKKQTTLCEILKLGPTPKRYPRRDGVPQKKPL